MGDLKDFLDKRKKNVVIFGITIILLLVLFLLSITHTAPEINRILPTGFHTTPNVVQFLPTDTPKFVKIMLPFINWAPTPAFLTETLVPTYESEINLVEPTLPDQFTKEESVIIDEACPNGCSDHKEGCDIKGNISYTTGERIYHVPGGAFYDKTVVDSQYGERWFCTEAEAIANGWRKSKR